MTGYPPGQGYPPQGHPQGQPGGYPQGQPGYPQGQPQGYPQRGYPQQGHPQGGYPPQGHPQGGYPPQGHPQGGYPQQGHPQGGYPPQGNPQGGYPPQGHPQGGYPPQGHPGGYPQGPGGPPKERPKASFNLMWFAIGLMVMLCMRGCVQVYVELAVRGSDEAHGAGTLEPEDEARIEELETQLDAQRGQLVAARNDRDEKQLDLRQLETRPEDDPVAKAELEAELDALELKVQELSAATQETQRELGELQARVLGEEIEQGMGEMGDAFSAGVAFILAYMVLAPFCYFLGGLIVAWRSPGRTFVEPALAAVVTVILLGVWEVIRYQLEGGLNFPCIACSSIFSFLLALAGALVGEKIQAPEG